MENSNELLSLVDKNWVLGKFSLAETVFEKSISDFKENLSKRLIPTVKEGDPETFLKKANDIFWQFSVFLDQPSIESLNQVSKRMTELPEMPIRKGDYWNKFLTFLRGHLLLTHAMSKLGIVGLTLLVYFAGVNNIGMSSQNAYNTSVQFLGIMIIGYLTITITILIKRKEK